MKIYKVGGAVRDRLLGKPVSDIDRVVVGATAENRDALVKTQIYYNLNDTTLPENAPTTVGYDAEAVDVFTHGSAVSQTLAGKAVGGQTRGGVAPAAKLNTAVSMELGGESTFRAWDDMANAGAAIASILIYVLMAAVLFYKPQGLFPAHG